MIKRASFFFFLGVFFILIATMAMAAPAPVVTLEWEYPPGVTNAEFVIYSKYDLRPGGTNHWYPVGMVTNQTRACVTLKRSSGLPVTNVFFKVVTLKLGR